MSINLGAVAGFYERFAPLGKKYSRTPLESIRTLYKRNIGSNPRDGGIPRASLY